ncbi:hypothetical protein ACAG25_12935 [Mycobacterium sp. pV006]|uniref:hypothetical protein n=1 Tax=Mycobacterium sp. pV006 TaxID=3238983 RepID=UPI00351BC4F4
MTTPDPSSFDDAPEADVVDQNLPVDDTEDTTVWSEAQRVAGRRDWQASEADLIDQSIVVPTDDDSEFDR